MKRTLIIPLSLALIAWSWLFLIDVARLSSSSVIGYVIILFAYLVLIGLTFQVVRLAMKWLKPILTKPSWGSICKLIVVWAAVEFFIAWIVSAIWMGRNGNWDNVSPFYSLTPMIMMTPLKFMTRLLGFFGTSAVVGTGLTILYLKNFRKYVIPYWAIVLLLNFTLWGIYRTPNGVPASITIVAEQLGQPQQIDVRNTDFVLLPEYGLDNYNSENVSTRFTNSVREVHFSGTRQTNGSDGTRNVLVYGTNQKGFIKEQAKSRLINAGEYLPFTLEVALRMTKSPVYDDFVVRRAVVRGKQPLEVYVAENSLQIGNAACSSIINTEDYRKLTRDGATLLANSASLEIFSGSRLFQIYHDGFAKFMAAANARPFLQSANNWKAFALDHNGSTLATLSSVGAQNVIVQTNSRKTPYTYLGEWVAVLGGIFVTKELLLPRLKRRTTNKKQKADTQPPSLKA